MTEAPRRRPRDDREPATAGRRYAVSESVLFRELQGEAVLLEIESGVYFGLNEIGSRIWNLLVAHGDLERVLTDLLDEYDVSEKRLRADLEAFLATLVERQLVRRL
ncbi:MAG: PqqD family protein [Thermoanaerobaculia bacterium]|nr:PqqD family protein [Thermoanaerobaculia bacterium]